MKKNNWKRNEKRAYLIINVVLASIAIALVLCFSSVSDENSRDLQIAPQTYIEKTYSIDLTEMHDVVIGGFFTVTNGTTSDIEAYILDSINFLNWKNGYEFTPIFESGHVTADIFVFSVNKTDSYYVVFDNSFSEASKEIFFKDAIRYDRTFFSYPIANWVTIVYLILITILAYHEFVATRALGLIERVGLVLVGYILFLIALSYFFSVEIFSYLGILATIINMIILVFNINLTQKNMKTQLLHSDRKKSLDKLYTIVDKSKNFREMKKKVEQLKETLDYQILPDNVKSMVQRQLVHLDVALMDAPDAPPEITQEEIDYYDEQQAEDYMQMTPEEQFEIDFEYQFNNAKSAIRKSIRDYFEEPSDD